MPYPSVPRGAATRRTCFVPVLIQQRRGDLCNLLVEERYVVRDGQLRVARMALRRGASRHALREHVRWRYARIRSGRRRAVRVHDGAGVRHLVRLGVRLLRVLHLPRGRGGVGRWCRGRCAPVADERKTTESDSLLRVIRSIALAESIQYC